MNTCAVNCVVADKTYVGTGGYYYYSGLVANSSRQVMSNYVISSDATLNLWAWRKVGHGACTLSLLCSLS